MQSNYLILKNATIENCKKICKNLSQPENLHMEKFNRLVKDLDNRVDASFMAPEEWARLLYNESVKRREQTLTVS